MDLSFNPDFPFDDGIKTFLKSILKQCKFGQFVRSFIGCRSSLTWPFNSIFVILKIWNVNHQMKKKMKRNILQLNDSPMYKYTFLFKFGWCDFSTTWQIRSAFPLATPFLNVWIFFFWKIDTLFQAKKKYYSLKNDSFVWFSFSLSLALFTCSSI